MKFLMPRLSYLQFALNLCTFVHLFLRANSHQVFPFCNVYPKFLFEVSQGPIVRPLCLWLKAKVIWVIYLVTTMTVLIVMNWCELSWITVHFYILYNELFLPFVTRFMKIQNDDLSWFPRIFLREGGNHFTS